MEGLPPARSSQENAVERKTNSYEQRSRILGRGRPDCCGLDLGITPELQSGLPNSCRAPHGARHQRRHGLTFCVGGLSIGKERKMASIGDKFSPGQVVPASGIYRCTSCGSRSSFSVPAFTFVRCEFRGDRREHRSGSAQFPDTVRLSESKHALSKSESAREALFLYGRVSQMFS